MPRRHRSSRVAVDVGLIWVKAAYTDGLLALPLSRSLNGVSVRTFHVAFYLGDPLLLPSLVAALTLSPAHTRAPDPCPPVSPAPGRPYFDFQVNQPAVYVGKDSSKVRPDATQNGRPPHPPEFALAQFVVDSLGVPVARSLKLLIQPTGLSMESVAEAIGQWRYQPARIGECRVSQLVQTPLRWR